MIDDISFDLKRSVMMRLRGSELIESALRTKISKRRVGMVMSAMKRAFSAAPVGQFNGELWRFGGKCYVKMPDSEFSALVNDCLEDLGLPYEDIMMTDKVAKVCKNEVMKKILRPMSNIVIFNNCAFDVDKRMEYAFNPKYIQMTMVHYDHDYNEHCFEFLNFLEYVLPERDKRRVLQEFLGSIFIDRRKAKLEKMLILLGTGANGKSVVFDTILGVLGRDNVTNFGLGALIGGNDRKHNIATLNGKRLNYCSEIRVIEIGHDSDALKTLISGEPTEARVLYGQNFMADSIPLLMANANRMPKLNDMSHGMMRRLCVLRFNITVPKSVQNPMLSEQLRSEYPGVFNWIIEGRERFIQNGYKLSCEPEVEQVLKEIEFEDNTVLKWMRYRRYFKGDPDNDAPAIWRPVRSMYSEYVGWSMAENIIPDSLNSFGRTLKSEGYKARRTGKGWEYALYGEEPKKSATTDAIVAVVEQKKKDSENKFWITEDGSPMVIGNKRAAHALGVSLATLNRCIDSGAFDGCYEKVDGGFNAFDLHKCKRVLIMNDKLKNKTREEEIRTERARLKQERWAFNRRMEALELPYRKQKHRDRLSAGLVWVPDAMTVDEIFKQEGGVLNTLTDDNYITNNTEDNGTEES